VSKPLPHEAPDRPSIAALLAKIGLSVVWLTAGALSAATLLHGGSRESILASAATVLGGPVVWLTVNAFSLRRFDEARAAVRMRALTQALLFALAWPSAMIGGSIISSLTLGAGEVNVSGMMQNAVTYLAITPSLAFFLSEVMAFAYLWTFSRPPGK
jgi:hypothetical protein